MQVGIILRRDGVDDTTQLAARELLCWLLQPEAAARPPSCEAVTKHAFFSLGGTPRAEAWRMPQLHMVAALGQTDKLVNLLSAQRHRKAQALAITARRTASHWQALVQGRSRGKEAGGHSAEGGGKEGTSRGKDPPAAGPRRHLLGKTPLHCAAENSQTASVAVLLRAGSDPDALAVDGSTPLMAASAAGDDVIVATLLRAGGTNASLRNNSGQSALDLAVDAEHEVVAAILRRHLEQVEVNLVVVLQSSFHTAIYLF